MLKKKLLPLLFLISTSLTTTAQIGQDTVNKIESIFSKYQPDHPGCMLSISRNGQLIYSKAWGLADLERNVPLTTSSITEAGSVSKQFTAASILLLQQQGKLSIDDDVRKYIPELPDYGSPIPIRYLLHHASGIRDWGAVATIAGWPRGTKAYTNDDALDIIIHQKRLNHSPNEEFLYSNSNYTLLTIIIQRVSGMSIADFTRRYIFEPAGMTHTQWRDNYKRIIAGRAIAYSKSRDSLYEINMPNENAHGHGGLLTTTEDLLKWSEYYGSGKPGGTAFLHRQLATENLNNGKSNEYGAGLFIGKLWGYDRIFHDGATAGYRAVLESFPQLDLSIAWLSNTSEFNGNILVGDVAALFVPGRVDNRKKEIREVFPDDEVQVRDAIGELNDYAGNYYSEEAQAGFKLEEQAGKLWLLRPGKKAGQLLFRVKDICEAAPELFDGEKARVEFIRKKGNVTGLKVTVSRARNVLFLKNASPVSPTPQK